MTSKEYLRQAYLLDAQINSQIRELESLKSMRGVVQGMTYGERIGSSGNRNIEAPFVKTIEKIMLLKYRYLDGMEWIDISQALAVSYRTVHRIHASALKNFEVPEKN